MGASAARTALIVTALAIVGLGALALAGWVHPEAPDSASLSYLPKITLPTVLLAAAVDGINPCAFTVLLLLVTAVIATYRVEAVSVKEMRSRLLGRGGVFVVAVFLTYLAVGVGAMSTLGMFTRRHWPARGAALIAVLMGLWMIKDALIPDSRWRLRAPARSAELARAAARKGTLPALFAGGVLIGLCTVPCSGAVYLGVLSLLALQPDRLLGYGYLVLYNVVFVLPLLAILAAAAARPTLRAIAGWNRDHAPQVRLLLGGGVVLGGLAILAAV